MRSRLICLVLGAIALANTSSESFGFTFPFTEEFATSDSNWKDGASLVPSYFATGGADGNGYISTGLSFEGLESGLVVFRGQGQFDSSDDAFVGDWLTAGVGVVRAYVRHNAPEPVDFFIRIATAANHPAVAIELSEPVPVGSDWKLLEFDISQSNPLLTVEGPPSFYNSTFSAVANVQIGVSPVSGLLTDSTVYALDLDGVSIGVPEPTALGLMLVGMAAVGLGRCGQRSRLG